MQLKRNALRKNVFQLKKKFDDFRVQHWLISGIVSVIGLFVLWLFVVSVLLTIVYTIIVTCLQTQPNQVSSTVLTKYGFYMALIMVVPYYFVFMVTKGIKNTFCQLIRKGK